MIEKSSILLTKRASNSLWLIVSLFLFIFIYAFSLWLAPYHLNGDQVHYRAVYDRLIGLDIRKGLNTYRSIIYSYEPIHFLIVWVSTNIGFEKNVVMSLLNACIVVLGIRWLKLRSFGIVLVFLLISTNYYLYVLFFTLEKLKIAILFLLIYLNMRPQNKLRYYVLALSFFSHFQMGIPILITAVAIYGSGIRKINHYKQYVLIALGILGLIAFLMIFSEFLYNKVNYYITYNSLFGGGVDHIQLLFVLIVIYISYSGKGAGIYSILMLVVISILGGDRLNMFLYFGLLYWVNISKTESRLVLPSLSLLLLYKSVSYISMVYNGGG